MKSGLPALMLLLGVACGTSEGDGAGLSLSEGCETYRSYVEDSCGLEFTEALSSSCESRVSQITETCGAQQAADWSTAYADGISCMDALDHCPGDDVTPLVSDCQTAYYTLAAPIETECLGYGSDGDQVNGFDSGVDGVGQGSCAPLEAIAFAPEPAADTALALYDEQVSEPLDLGFAVDWFGTEVTSLSVSSNGFVGVGELSEGCCEPVALPVHDHLDGIVALGMTDLDPSLGGGIAWSLRGAEPNRRFVLDYAADRAYGDGVPDLVTQLIVHEGTNLVELHTTTLAGGTPVTQGIESLDGLEAGCLAERVQADISLDGDAVRFHVGR